MAKGIDFFNSVEHLEQKCIKCGTKIDWEVTTRWCDEKEGHVCKECGGPVE